VKFAYFVRPHLGGTYSAYQSLREGLAPHGIEVRWIGLGTPPASEAALSRQASSHGAFVSPYRALSEREEAARLAEMLEQERFDGVFINVLAERIQMNIARYLPRHILRIMVVHNITPGTYAAAHAIRNNVHATVGVSERCRRDLVERYGFPREWTAAIPHAVDTAAFSHATRTTGPTQGLRLLFLGRIEDASKGVFWLDDIMDHLPPSIRLTVAGDGPDQPRLMNQLAPHGERVRFLGNVAAGDVPALAADHDVLVMPSRFEGFGFTIIEAMAAGCVPVASRIAGVTDTIIEDGISGLLFPVGDRREAARQIGMLASDPLLLRRLSRDARRRAAEHFGLETMAAGYLNLIEKLRRESPPINHPLPLDSWSTPRGMRPGLRTYLPSPVKNWLRVVRERL
jgi:glycosyltransferase involved in cell wall biosynthesis